VSGLAIDSAFAEQLFAELQAGTVDAPGVTRAAYGEGEEFAHGIMRREAASLGLSETVDAAGNLYLTLPGANPALPAWVVGSHLDSVPHGGNYDGTAGVLAGLAAVKALRDAGIAPARPVTVMVTRAEESCWFPVSYIGSRAALGMLPPESLDVPRSDSGRTLADHMAALGLQPERVRRGEARLTPTNVHGFIELHIEQGPVLEAADLPVGLVTAIAGSFRYRKARCIGEWGHSGAVPRAQRRDAVFALAEFITTLDRLWEEVTDAGEQATITVGEIGTDPALHGFSKIPGEVAFCLDVRSGSPACLNMLHDRLLEIVGVIEARRAVRFDLGPRTGSTPTALDPGLRCAFSRTAERVGICVLQMPSGAGHDAAAFALAGIPSALVFLRNQNGSHNPDETMRIEDFAAGATLLAHFLAVDGG
jgi:N-carbamoyl-L-amino-acid hydrolase